MKTTQECWQALIDGETVISEETGLKVIMKDGEPMWADNGAPARAALFNVSDWSIYTPPEWYDDIPECGVLCWCWDNCEKSKYIEIVNKYDSESSYPFITQHEDFKKATPLTKQEIKQLLCNAPETQEK